MLRFLRHLYRATKGFLEAVRELEVEVSDLKVQLRLAQEEATAWCQRVGELHTENQHLRSQIRNLTKSIAPPSEQYDMSNTELEALLREVCGNILIYLGDIEYKITTLSEMKRFVEEAGVYEMEWKAEAPDCDDFTRKLKGELVCPGWWWQPALDVWFIQSGPFGGGHSEFLTPLVDDEDEEKPIRLYLIEPQEQELFELADEVFEENRPWLIKH